MLLRSSSTPILNSWIPQPKENSSPEPETLLHRTTPKSRSVSFTLPPISLLSTDVSSNKITRDLTVPKKNNCYVNSLSSISVHDVEEAIERSEMLGKLFFSSGGLLKESGSDVWGEELVVGGGCGCGGRGGSGSGSDGGRSFNWDSNNGNNNNDHSSTEVYYQNMIESNPGNALFLGNYAKFLREVKRDYVKAEEYCGRAILANPYDGDILSLYADLIWRSHKDAPQAESYFDQAVQAAPDDCYVLASYAKFLWDSEEDDEEDQKEETALRSTSQPSILQGFGHHVQRCSFIGIFSI